MSDMIERVAKAMTEECGDDDLLNDVRAKGLARAAIEAMREYFSQTTSSEFDSFIEVVDEQLGKATSLQN